MNWDKLSEWVGRQSPPKTHTVEREQIVAFARAVKSGNPIHLDPETAREHGYRDVLAPPTFPVTLSPHPIDGVDLPTSGLIHGEQQFRYGTPVVAGDRITVVNRVESVKVRRDTAFITFCCEGVHQNGDLAFSATSLIMMREEAADATQ